MFGRWRANRRANANATDVHPSEVGVLRWWMGGASDGSLSEDSREAEVIRNGVRAAAAGALNVKQSSASRYCSVYHGGAPAAKAVT